jgi:hypothetical protein
MHKKVHPMVWHVSALLLLLAAAVLFNSGKVTEVANSEPEIPTPVVCAKSFPKPDLGETATYTYLNPKAVVEVEWLSNGDVVINADAGDNKTNYLFGKDTDQWLFYVDNELIETYSSDEETTTYLGEAHLFQFYDGHVTGYTTCPE